MKRLLCIGLLLATPMIKSMGKKAELYPGMDKTLTIPLLCVTDPENNTSDLSALLDEYSARLVKEKSNLKKWATGAGGGALALWGGLEVMGDPKKDWKNHKLALGVGGGAAGLGVFVALYPDKALELLKNAKGRVYGLVAKVRPNWISAEESIEAITQETAAKIQHVYARTLDRAMMLLYPEAATQAEPSETMFNKRITELQEAVTTQKLAHDAEVGKLLTAIAQDREAALAQSLALVKCKEDLGKVSAITQAFQQKTKDACKKPQYKSVFDTVEAASKTIEILVKQCDDRATQVQPLLALHLKPNAEQLNDKSGTGAGSASGLNLRPALLPDTEKEKLEPAANPIPAPTPVPAPAAPAAGSHS